MNAIIVYLPPGDKKVIIPSGYRYSINSEALTDQAGQPSNTPSPLIASILSPTPWIVAFRENGDGETGWIRQAANYAIISLVKGRGLVAGCSKMKFHRASEAEGDGAERRYKYRVNVASLDK